MQPLVVRSPYRVQVDVLYALFLREVSARFGRSRVGLLWTLIEPLAQVIAPVLIFGFILDRVVTGYEYPVYLIYGLLPYYLFRTICVQTMEGVNASRGLLSYRPIHLIDMLFTKAIFTIALDLFLFLIIGIGLAVLGFDVVPARPVEWLFSLLGVCLFALGLGMMLAALVSFMPDARAIVRVLFMPLYLVSGVVLPVSRFPSWVVDWLALNPLMHWLEVSRQFGLPHYRAMPQLSGAMVFFSMAVPLLLGLALYRLRRLSRVTT
ncbi:MAG: ABC transporter permease [Burkholderiales bacterium]|nr:ABC transporter permease [Burkholderiales bacterium]